MFEIDPAFIATSQALGDLGLCHVRLQQDARWPWLVLIPRIAAARELEDLAAVDRTGLMAEIVQAGNAARAVGAAMGFRVEKLNVGALGNVTGQLHVHVLGRRPGDPAWPGPVWGFGKAMPFDAEGLDRTARAARDALGF